MAEPAGTALIHATAIALAGRAVLIRGAPGAGKSDLALRCLAVASPLLAEPAVLVADDQVSLSVDGGRLVARPPPTIAGKLEIRGLGIRDFPYLAAAEVVLAADLVAGESVERLPDPQPFATIAGVRLPLVRLAPFEPSAAIKLLLALSDAR